MSMIRKNHLVFETIILIVMVIGLIIHVVYRNAIENRGWIIIDGQGSLFLVRDEKEAIEYEKLGFGKMQFEPNSLNSLEIYDEEMNPITRFVMSGYQDLTKEDLEKMRTYLPVLTESNDCGSFTINDLGNDAITVNYHWMTTNRGNHYMVIQSTSRNRTIALAIDAVITYLGYIFILALIVRSMFTRSKLNIAEYQNVTLSEN